MYRSRARLVLPAMLLAGAVATGCGSNDDHDATDHGSGHATTTAVSTSAASDVVHNDADVSFLQGMYPHHAQAIGMAEMVDGRSDNAELIALAAQIEAAQGPEMDRMVSLLAQFGEPASMDPAAMGEHMGGATDDGMLSPDQMHALMSAEGAEFEQLWLDGMIAHHEGAIEMSNTVIAEGTNPDVRAMAESIVATQQAEIDQMRTMLGE